MGECDALDGLGAMGKLGCFRFKEFSPGRGVVVEVSHLDDGSGSERRRLRLRSVVCGKAPGMGVIGPAAGKRKARDGSHRSQGFAAKAHGGNAFEIVECRDFRCGVSGQGQRQLIAGDAATIVDDADELDATFLKLNLNR